MYLIMILDDHSRMIVGGKLYYQENTANFQKPLKNVIAAYGIPNKLCGQWRFPITMNSPPLSAALWGTVLLHTPVRDRISKDKLLGALTEKLLVLVNYADFHRKSIPRQKRKYQTLLVRTSRTFNKISLVLSIWDSIKSINLLFIFSLLTSPDFIDRKSVV